MFTTVCLKKGCKRYKKKRKKKLNEKSKEFCCNFFFSTLTAISMNITTYRYLPFVVVEPAKKKKKKNENILF